MTFSKFLTNNPYYLTTVNKKGKIQSLSYFLHKNTFQNMKNCVICNLPLNGNETCSNVLFNIVSSWISGKQLEIPGCVNQATQTFYHPLYSWVLSMMFSWFYLGKNKTNQQMHVTSFWFYQSPMWRKSI